MSPLLPDSCAGVRPIVAALCGELRAEPEIADLQGASRARATHPAMPKSTGLPRIEPECGDLSPRLQLSRATPRSGDASGRAQVDGTAWNRQSAATSAYHCSYRERTSRRQAARVLRPGRRHSRGSNGVARHSQASDQRLSGSSARLRGSSGLELRSTGQGDSKQGRSSSSGERDFWAARVLQQTGRNMIPGRRDCRASNNKRRASWSPRRKWSGRGAAGDYRHDPQVYWTIRGLHRRGSDQGAGHSGTSDRRCRGMAPAWETALADMLDRLDHGGSNLGRGHP